MPCCDPPPQHHPHEAPPAWPEQSSDIGSYRGMLWGTDVYVGQLTQLLKDKGMSVEPLDLRTGIGI